MKENDDDINQAQEFDFFTDEMEPYSTSPAEMLQKLARELAMRTNGDIVAEIRGPRKSVFPSQFEGLGELVTQIRKVSGDNDEVRIEHAPTYQHRLVLCARQLSFELEVLRVSHGVGFYPTQMVAIEGSLPDSPYEARTEDSFKQALQMFAKSPQITGLVSTLRRNIRNAVVHKTALSGPVGESEADETSEPQGE